MITSSVLKAQYNNNEGGHAQVQDNILKIQLKNNS